MASLKEQLRDRLVSGFSRSSVQTCSRWSEKYRMMGRPFSGPWTHKFHPWLRDVADDKSEAIDVSKAAQLGFTEVGMNKAFYEIDINANNVLYILPTSGDASDFSASRFDPALELSTHLANLFTDVQNVGHKRAGSASLFIRGSRSKSKLKSIPAPLIIEDEVDEMDQDNIAMAGERAAGQPEHQTFRLSNPTVENYGIDRTYKDSDQRIFHFRCPHCNKYINLTPDNLIITAESPSDPKILDSHLVCGECKQLLKHEEKIIYMQNCRWIPTLTDKLRRGYTLSQLYSMAKRPDEIAVQVLKARYDQVEEQNLWNQVFGRPHHVKGAKVTDKNIEDCFGRFILGQAPRPGYFVTMGVDVGKVLHYEIDEWTLLDNGMLDVNLSALPRIVDVGTVADFEDLDPLFMKNNIMMTVIDANPERRKSFETCQRLQLARMCFYGNSSTGKMISEKPEEYSVTVDRTSWLDLSIGRFIRGQIVVPPNIPHEYKQHIKALTKIPKRKTSSNANRVTAQSTSQNIMEYVNTDADHFAHARNYSEIAFKKLMGSNANEDVT